MTAKRRSGAGKKYEAPSLANLLPLLDGDEFDALVADIMLIGMRKRASASVHLAVLLTPF